MDYSNLGDVDGQVNYVKAAGAVMDKVPDGDTLENVLTTYSDIVYDNLTGVTKKNQTVKVEGISKECTVLTAKADSKKVCDIAAKMAKQLKKDKDIKAIIEKADKSAYTQFKDGVSEFEKELLCMWIRVVKLSEERILPRQKMEIRLRSEAFCRRKATSSVMS